MSAETSRRRPRPALPAEEPWEVYPSPSIWVKGTKAPVKLEAAATSPQPAWSASDSRFDDRPANEPEVSMKAIQGVLLGGLLLLVSVGIASAQGKDAAASGAASAKVHSGAAVETQAPSTDATLQAIRDRAKQ